MRPGARVYGSRGFRYMSRVFVCFDLLHCTLTCAAPPLPSSKPFSHWYSCVWMSNQKRIEQTTTTTTVALCEWWIVAACSSFVIFVTNFLVSALGAQYVDYRWFILRSSSSTTAAAVAAAIIFRIEKCTLCDVVHNRWNIFSSVFYYYYSHSLFFSIAFPLSTVENFLCVQRRRQKRERERSRRMRTSVRLLHSIASNVCNCVTAKGSHAIQKETVEWEIS